ncbi:MAG: hypothetical protein WCX71_00295 [Candidatus Buchananbacteria bacterium]
MNQKIIKQAEAEFKKLSKKYSGFINVILDNWRGYRFIYDCVEVRNCKNQCATCRLYNLLKNKKNDKFTTCLVLATPEDKKIFGSQNYLNCKTVKQYQNCYINFIKQKKLTKKELIVELNLVKDLKFIYSRKNDLILREKLFKQGILDGVVKFNASSKNKYK